MLRLMSDLLPALLATCDGMLTNLDLRWQRRGGADGGDGRQGLSGQLREGLADRGPRRRRGESPASNSSTPAPRPMATRILANGGRVLNVTATGGTVAEAQARAYAAVDRIDWPDGFCRRDIGWRAIKRETARG